MRRRSRPGPAGRLAGPVRPASLAAAATAAAVSLVAGASLAGCSSSGSTTTSASRTHHVTVLAAASLTETFGDLATRLGGAPDRLAVTYSFAGSQQLVAQIQAGAPADVVATADEASMQRLTGAGLVETPVVFARNRLAIAVRPGNPKHVTGLADLGRPDLLLVLADPSVPAGRYAADVLQRAGVTVKPRSLELDVKSALRTVTSGEADAAIVYQTDVQAAGSAVASVAIPDAANALASYPVAVLKQARDPEVARAFVRALTGSVGRQVLDAHGFALP